MKTHLEIMTYPVIQEIVTDVIVQEAQRGISEHTAGIIARALTTNNQPEADLIDAIVFAQGCHAAAKAMRMLGDLDKAEMYFALGQDLLTKAVEAYSALEAAFAQTQPRH